MSTKKEIEFNNIVKDILSNKEFISLKYEPHHGINRLEHSLNVAYTSFNIANFFHLNNIEEITRAALLHDFFKNSEVPTHAFVNHPKIALVNAKKYYNLTKVQENIIISHMFPASLVLPKYKESWIVTIADKHAAIKECSKNKIPLSIGAAFIFIFNILIIPR